MKLDEIVNVVITRETTPVTRQGFGTGLILGSNANFDARIQFFTEPEAVADAVCGGTGSAEYKAALDYFSQSPRPVKVGIGHIAGVKIITDDGGTYTAGDIKATVNGNEITESFDTDKDTSLGNLATSIEALDDVNTAVYDNVAHTITITPVSGEVLAVSVDLSAIAGDMEMTVSAGAMIDSTITDALDAIVLENNDWYGLCTTTRTKDKQLLIAEWIEAKQKVYSAASDESDIVDVSDASDTDTIAAQLKAAGYDRTFLTYLTNASTQYPDAAALGKALPKDPGTYTMKFKKLASITADSLTTTRSTNARDKNCNVFEPIGGVNIFRDGKAASGEFIDVIIFIDWVHARVTEEVFSVLVNNDKVPYTENGIASIESAVDKPLSIGQSRGGISPTAFDDEDSQIGGYYISVPELEDISQTDKANRYLQDVNFVAYLAGAIHKVKINGRITL